MSDDKTARAANMLAEAWRSHTLLPGLAASDRPTTLEEAHAIQDAVIAILGEPVGGWKAGARRPARGAIFGSRIYRSPASIPAASQHLRIIEGEVAFLVTEAMPPQPEDYTREQVASRVSACAAIEIIDSRYVDYASAPDLDRTADLFSSGAFVYGAPVADWTGLDLAGVKVSLSVDGDTVLEQEGGHPTGDPLNACVMLVNSLRTTIGVPAGQIVTTGSYTGVKALDPGSTARVHFAGLGAAEVTFAA